MRPVFVIILCLICLSLTGQSGYLGKRIILKTDLATPLLDRGIEAGVEIVLLRNVSAYLGVQTSNNKYTQYLEDYKLRFGEYPSELGSIKDFQVGLQLKYFASKAIPAPKGTYWYSGFSMGKADLVWNEFFHDNLFPDNEEYVRYAENGILSSKFDLGFGFQELAWRILVFDFSLGLNYSTLHLAGHEATCTDCEIGPAGFMGNYGPNLIVLSRRASSNPGGVGVSARVRVGFLLF